MTPQVFRDVDILASLAGIMDQHIEDLRGGSLRGKLKKAKTEVQPPAQKAAKKDQQSL